MYPEQLAAPALAEGSVVRISDVHLDVLVPPSLSRLTNIGL